MNFDRLLKVHLSFFRTYMTYMLKKHDTIRAKRISRRKG